MSYILDQNGRVISTYDVFGKEYVAPVIADINNDGRMEIIQFERNTLHMLDSLGKGIWNYPKDNKFGEFVCVSPVVADINGDGLMECIYMSGDQDHYDTRVLSNKGKEIWKYKNFPNKSKNFHAFVFPAFSPAIADINNDGKMEIIIGEDYDLYVFDYKGNVLWNYHTGDRIISSPIIMDINNDGKLEIIFCSCDMKYYVLNNSGTKLWDYEIPADPNSCIGSINAAPIVADINNDGKMEIIGDGGNGSIVALDYLGNELWKYNNKDMIMASSPAAADLNNDGKLEMVFISNNGITAILNSEGKCIWEHDFRPWPGIDGSAFVSSPAIVDINNDGILEILFGCPLGFYVYGIKNKRGSKNE